jgi:hypothetical protein
MTILKHIELFLDSTYSADEQKQFLFSSRCICNFVERMLEKEKIQSHFSRVNIHCSQNPKLVGVHKLKNEPYLEIIIHEEIERIDSLSYEAIQKQFSKIITKGFKVANAVTPMPLEECIMALKNFELNEFKNQWIHKDKSWPRWKCRCVITAELTIENFVLEQMIYSNGELIARHIVAKTKPRDYQ